MFLFFFNKFLSGEYPTNNYKVDGFTKRMLDYAELERYNKDDVLRFVRDLI